MSFRIIFLQLLLCCFSSLAWARPQRIVVWEFVGLEVQEEFLFSAAEVVRQEAVELSSKMDIRIIPREYLPVYLRYYGGDCKNILGGCTGIAGKGTDADFQVFGNLFRLEDKYVLNIKLHETKTGKMLGLMTVQTQDAADLSSRLQSQVRQFLQKGLEAAAEEEHLIVLASSVASKIPSKKEKIKRLLWVEERRRELDAQFKQARAYTEEKWQLEADEDWKEIEPYLGTGERHEMLRVFVDKYNNASVKVEYWDPNTEKITKKNLALNLPIVDIARQELFLLNTFYAARLIPAGGFEMGCAEGTCFPEETPAHSVRITKDFYMMQGEVTQELYELVTEDNPSGHVGPKFPVDNINWYDVIVFANQLSEKEGLEKCYEYPSMSAHFPGGEIIWNKDCNGWRLPTEAEWERAALGGGEFLYAGSDFEDEVGWGRDTGAEESQVSCLKRTNGYDLCDMSGNISEWVWDACHEREISGTLEIDPIFNTDPKALRRCYYSKGGSYKNSTEMLRIPSVKEVLIGAGESPRGFFTYPGDGFRLVRTVQD